MRSLRSAFFVLGVIGLVTGCAKKPPTPVATLPPIEIIQLNDRNLTCEQIQAQYEDLEKELRKAGNPYRPPTPDSAGSAVGAALLGSLGAAFFPRQDPYQVAYEQRDAAERYQRGLDAKARRRHLAMLYQRMDCKLELTPAKSEENPPGH